MGNKENSKMGLKIVFAEFLGTLILSFIGIGAGLQGTGGTAGAIAGGLGVALGIYTAASISGGHVNPAVTAGFLIQGRLANSIIGNLVMFLIYFGSQLLGAFVGAALSYCIYFDKIEYLSLEDITCLFATCPTEEYENGIAIMLIDQILGTFILVNTVLVTTDPDNELSPGLAPLLIGFSATAASLSYGDNAGGAINPARDLGPRLWASIFEGGKAFGEANIIQGPNADLFFWIPLVGPLLGGLLAGLVNLFLKFSSRVHGSVQDVQNDETGEKEEPIEEFF